MRKYFTVKYELKVYMSQSDYIRHKRNVVMIKNVGKMENVLPSQTHIQFKGYMTPRVIEPKNLSDTYNQLQLDSRSNYYGMELDLSGCSLKNDSSGKDLYGFCPDQIEHRDNKELNKTGEYGRRGYKRHHGYKEYFIYRKFNNLLCTAKELQACDEFLYHRRNGNLITDSDSTKWYL